MIQDIFYTIEQFKYFQNFFKGCHPRAASPGVRSFLTNLETFSSNIEWLTQLAEKRKSNQFFFTREMFAIAPGFGFFKDEDNFKEMEDWLIANLPNRYSIYRQKYEYSEYFYTVLDFGEDTAAAGLFKLFRS
jgi:hypothetical protein